MSQDLASASWTAHRQLASVSWIRGAIIPCLVAIGALVGVRWAVDPTIQPGHVPGDCGPTSLYALALAMGVNVARNSVTDLFHGETSLTSFYGLQVAASRLGIRMVGLSMDTTTLLRKRPLGIIHVDGRHFVAVVGYAGSAAVIEDAINGGALYRGAWDLTALAQRWDGRILTVAAPRSLSPRPSHEGCR